MADIRSYIQKLKQVYQDFSRKAKGRFQAIRSKYPGVFKAFKIGAIAFTSLILLVMGLAVSVYFGAFGQLPTYAELRNVSNYTASEVYSEDEVLLGKYFIENRVNADLEEMPTSVIEALVATEDARFFQHSGIDFRAWVRVFFRTVLLMDASGGGGSTLSQQLAKNLFPRQSYSIFTIPVNKIKELFTARRLEKLYTKEELLRMYLNTVSFGGKIFGVKVAAQRFFDKSLEQLTIEESALLVGMLKGPTYYNPVNHPERALTRRNTVLNQMSKYGYLSAVNLDSLKALPLELNYYREDHNQGLATYFREHLRLELQDILKDYKKEDGSSYNIYTDGLKIYTSINAKMQRFAEEAVQTHMPKLQEQFYKNWGKRPNWGSNEVIEKAVAASDRYQRLKKSGVPQGVIDSVFATPVKMVVFDWENGEVEKEMSPLDSVKYYTTLLHAGFLAIEPATGMIKAWIGGINHKYFQYDHVKAHRQVGSTFKPLVFTQALRNGMMPCEYTYNERITYAEFDNWSPRNSDGQYGGVYSMEGALSNSVNVVAVETLLRAGIDSVRDLASRMGISRAIPPVPAIGLGSVDASLYEMVQVYGTYANYGKKPVLHYLDRIETSDGRVLVSFERPNPRDFKRIITEEEAKVMTHMLESVVDSGTAARLKYRYRLYNDIAGKTGTTQNQSDGWFMGYTPDIVAGVWVGAESPKVHFRTLSAGQGSNTALPIFGEFMSKVVKDREFRGWKNSTFESPTDTMLYLMDCPPYLEEMPLIVEYLQDYNENPGFIDRVYRELLPQFDPDDVILKRQRRNETNAEYIERMRKYNERMIDKEEERRQKLKEYWSKLIRQKKFNFRKEE
jgi:penicillin-binding protein 1A